MGGFTVARACMERCYNIVIFAERAFVQNLDKHCGHSFRQLCKLK